MNDKDTQKTSSVQKYVFEELDVLAQKVAEAEDLPQELSEKTNKMISRLNRMAELGGYGAEFDTLSKYIDIVTSIPWSAKTKDELDLQKTKEMLDKHHYGMDDVKERVLEYMATLILRRERAGEDAIVYSPVLLFVGLQGIGKTTLAISIAEAMGREFIRVAMGGIGSVLELRGRSKVYPEAEPGQIIKGLIRVGVRNPVILMDEIEKASGSAEVQHDIMAALLEILDPNQNHSFRDHYVDYPYDLSDVMFICSANNTGPLSTALMDRLEVIKMRSYTDDEKINIARDFLLPKIREKAGLAEDQLQFEPDLWPNVVRPFGFDSGIRSLGRTLEAISRKVAKEIVDGKTDKVYITADNLRNYLPK